MPDYIKKYDTGFTQVANVVLNDENLSLEAKGLYSYLFSKPSGWEFHPSTMAKDLKESHKTILRIVKELIEKGYIKRTQSNVNGKFGGNVYEFNRIDEIPYAQKSACGKTYTHNNTNPINNTNNIYTLNDGTNDCLPFNDVPNLNREPYTGYIPKEEKRTKEEKVSDSFSDAFEEFWKLYPRKVTKSKALSIYTNILKKKQATPNEILHGLNGYIAELERNHTEQQYIAHPTTWLNQERWIDYKDKKPVKRIDMDNLVCCGPRPVW